MQKKGIRLPQMYITPKYDLRNGGVAPLPPRPVENGHQQQLSDREKIMIKPRYSDYKPRAQSYGHQDSFRQIDQYRIYEILGKGQFSSVYRAVDSKTMKVYALKIVDKKHGEQLIKREISIQQSINHKNSVHLFSHFQDQDNHYMVMEYCPQGDLKSKTNGNRSEAEIKLWVKQLLSVLQYIHAIGYMHRDIKPENVLIKDGQVKLGDYGYAAEATQRRASFVGTLKYLSPEMISGGGQQGEGFRGYDKQTDIWSLGILTYELLFGCTPFNDPDEQNLMEKITHENIKFPEQISDEAKEFLNCCLQKNPLKRSNINQLMKSKWLQ
ncbi:hypothetical protein pb186bvf_013060 [Paramecium bursaria]